MDFVAAPWVPRQAASREPHHLPPPPHALRGGVRARRALDSFLLRLRFGRGATGWWGGVGGRGGGKRGRPGRGFGRGPARVRAGPGRSIHIRETPRGTPFWGPQMPFGNGFRGGPRPGGSWPARCWAAAGGRAPRPTPRNRPTTRARPRGPGGRAGVRAGFSAWSGVGGAFLPGRVPPPLVVPSPPPEKCRRAPPVGFPARGRERTAGVWGRIFAGRAPRAPPGYCGSVPPAAEPRRAAGRGGDRSPGGGGSTTIGTKPQLAPPRAARRQGGGPRGGGGGGGIKNKARKRGRRGGRSDLSAARGAANAGGGVRGA